MSNNTSLGCQAPIIAGVFVFLITLIKGDFWNAVGTGILTIVVWGVIFF